VLLLCASQGVGAACQHARATATPLEHSRRFIHLPIVTRCVLHCHLSPCHLLCYIPAGFALAFGGGKAVSWYEPRPDFPYVRGIVPIVISWFLSPLLAALITLVFFLLIRTFVLRRQNSTKIAFYVLPLLIFITIFISLLFVLVSAVF
jgi:sodium-dependent phosphate transporter